MPELSDLNKSFIKNMMLTESHQQIAALFGIDKIYVSNYIDDITLGTGIITKQMLIDINKKPVVKKVKPEKPTRNTNKQIQFNSRKKIDRLFPSYKTMKVDYDKLISVKIDDRTYLFIQPGEDREKAIKKFYANRISQKRKDSIY